MMRTERNVQFCFQKEPMSWPKILKILLLIYGETEMVREVYENELSKILELYLHLHEEKIPEMTSDVHFVTRPRARYAS